MLKSVHLRFPILSGRVCAPCDAISGWCPDDFMSHNTKIADDPAPLSADSQCDGNIDVFFVHCAL
jgi:hypothetical protein